MRKLSNYFQFQNPKPPSKTPTQKPLFFHTKEERREERNQEKGECSFKESFQLHKSRGQHILTNPRVLDSIVRRAQVRPTDTVLEIGPGTGNLTVRLLEAARRVVAVEIDDRMVDVVQRRVSKLGLEDRLNVITGNALKAQFPQFDLCVANIPYGISSPLIAKLLFEPPTPCFRSATLLLQKEFAQRLLAKPDDSEFNRLAVNVGLVANVELLMNVSKKDFVPCPKVDSSLIQIRHKPEVPAVCLNEWLAFTRTCFSNKNKTLGAIFKQKRKILELLRGAQTSAADCGVFEDGSDEGYDSAMEYREDVGVEGGDALESNRFKEKIVAILKSRGFDGKRPSKMSNEELLDLLRLFNQEGVLFHR